MDRFWFHNLVFYLVVCGITLALAAAICCTALFVGVAWAILLAIVLAAAVAWLAGNVGLGAADFAVPWWGGLVVGLLVGIAWVAWRYFNPT